MFYGFLTLILNIFTLEFFLSDFSNTSLLKYPLFKKVKISRNYSFKNLFRLATEHFEKTFDEIYSILFTCIVLSDVNFTRHTSVEAVFNGGVLSIVYYFHSLYCMIVCGGSKDLRIVQQNKGVEIVEDWRFVNEQFGLHMRHFGPEFNNNNNNNNNNNTYL